jgi:protein SEY1
MDETPAEVIKDQLSGDMQTIWREIAKPSEFATSPMSQFFDVDFHLFSHFRYEKSKFIEQIADLRQKLTNKSHPGYLWNQSYITDVPADGFDIYAKNIWDVVKDNRDLDLPSQKEMLALFRCGEISDKVYADFLERIAPIIQLLKNNQQKDTFGADLSEIVRDCFGK